jgi:hypothetical protein
MITKPVPSNAASRVVVLLGNFRVYMPISIGLEAFHKQAPMLLSGTTQDIL